MPIIGTLRRCLFALLAMMSLNAPVAQAVEIGLEPASIFAGTGDTIALDLVVSGLGDYAPDSLGGFDISIGFDPAIFAFTSYTLGGYLGDLSLLEALDIGFGDLGGAVNIAEVSLLSALELDALQPGAFTLATLNFNVIDLAAGEVSQFSVLPDAVLADANGNALAAGTGAVARVEGVGAPVPVPGTIPLLLAALLGVFRVRAHRSPRHRIATTE